MEPTSDQPPPETAQPIAAAAAANPTPIHPPAHNHPPYAEMITAAISSLNERDGSSKRAIMKYIESNYTNLPSTHSALLSHHLKRLKYSGQVVMVKHSYKLPRSGAPANQVSLNGTVSDPPPSIAPKRKPGRPPKSIQAPVPVLMPVNPVPFEPLGSVYVTVNGGAARPAKLKPERGPGRPAKSGEVGKRGRGRPKGFSPKVKRQVVVPPVGNGGVLPENVAPAVVKKRRGRPPKAGGGVVKKLRKVGNAGVQKKKQRRLSGKPLGRPKKDNQLLASYLDVKAKLEFLQSRIKQTVGIIKPYLTIEPAVSAVQELETLANIEVNPPSNVPHQQPQAETQAQAQAQTETQTHPEIQVVLTGE